MDREEWNKRYAEKAFVWTVEPNRFVVDETRGLTPGRALDLGAGEGRNAVWLAERGWQVTAVDFSDMAIEKGRRLAEARAVKLEWVTADLAEYEPVPEAYDLVLICYLQVPTATRRRVMAKAREAVAPAGTFLWIAHDLSNLNQGVGGPQTPAVLSTPQDVAGDLPEFKIAKAEVVRREVIQNNAQGLPETAVALDTLVRATRPSLPPDQGV